MKKILTLLVALTLVVCMCSALAEEPVKLTL